MATKTNIIDAREIFRQRREAEAETKYDAFVKDFNLTLQAVKNRAHGADHLLSLTSCLKHDLNNTVFDSVNRANKLVNPKWR